MCPHIPKHDGHHLKSSDTENPKRYLKIQREERRKKSVPSDIDLNENFLLGAFHSTNFDIRNVHLIYTERKRSITSQSSR